MGVPAGVPDAAGLRLNAKVPNIEHEIFLAGPGGQMSATVLGGSSSPGLLMA